ncbi:unnamed protein product [Closterium sp. Naga37s-1]|nr:unnamed protein product [Closterium sp. Naga37s-1]
MARRLSPWGLSLFLLALLAVVLPELCAADDDGSSRQYDGKTGAKKLIAEMKKKGYNTALSLFESTGIVKELPAEMSYHRLTVLAPTDDAFAKLPARIAKELPEAMSYYRLTVLAPTDEAPFAKLPARIAKELPEAMSYYRLISPSSRPQKTPLHEPFFHTLLSRPRLLPPGIAKELPEAMSYYRIAKELPEAMSYYRLTVLAPTDEAFAKLSSSVTKRLSKAAMRDIAMLHIVKGRKDAAMLVRMQREHEWRTPSKNGEAGLFKATETKVKPVKLHAEGGKNVTITKPDSVLLMISAVHGIDKVIIPGSKLTGAKKKLSLKESLDLTNGEEDMDYDN